MARSEYLSYGGADEAQAIDASGTQRYLEGLGFGGSYLRQARDAIAAREGVEMVFDAFATNHCDFCFMQIMGGEFELLKDGRERCSRCSRTALTTHEQFVDEYEQVRRNMELAFGISLRTPLVVKMVNAREIARKTEETFVPTGGVDPRVLGFVMRSKNGLELFIENGSPRLAAITTMAHELTHVWQFTHWNDKEIASRYGKKNRLAVQEGMAVWAQVQYLYFTRDFDYAQRQEAYSLQRNDVYGDGFKVFRERYPLSVDGEVDQDSPFHKPLPL